MLRVPEVIVLLFVLIVVVHGAPCSTYVCPKNYSPNPATGLTCPTNDPNNAAVCLEYDINNKYACCLANICGPDKSKYPGYKFSSSTCDTEPKCWPFQCQSQYSGTPYVQCDRGNPLFKTSGCFATCQTYSCGSGYIDITSTGSVRCSGDASTCTSDLCCNAVSCPVKSSPPGSCKCYKGFAGTPNWDSTASKWTHSCTVVACPSKSSPPGSCKCKKGFVGTPSWDSLAAKWTHSCTPATCPPKSYAPGVCLCRIGYRGTPNWDSSSQSWKHSCAEADCPQYSSPPGSCKCETGYKGTPTWDSTGQYWRHSCSAVACPANCYSPGNCKCKDGYKGIPSWDGNTQLWAHNCSAVSCPNKSSPPGTCNCETGYKGFPAWDSTYELWTHKCSSVLCPPKSLLPGICNCIQGYSGDATWDSSSQIWTHSCSIASCPLNSLLPDCNCNKGFSGTPFWDSVTHLWAHKCVQVSCPSGSSPPNCLCNNGHTGTSNWDSVQQKWTHSCTAVSCPLNSNSSNSCICDVGYIGSPNWEAAIGSWTHSCTLTTCPSHSSSPGICTCDEGYSGNPNWDISQQSWSHTCKAAACPSNSSPRVKCVCDDGFSGTPEWDKTRQLWSHNCTAASCPLHSSTPGICTCNSGFKGTPNWDSSHRVWTHNCASSSSSSSCPSKSSLPSCKCDVGYSGTPNWDSSALLWTHTCKSVSCPLKSSSTGTCKCDKGYVGTPNWNDVTQLWTHKCTAVSCPPSSSLPGVCNCDNGFTGTPNWDYSIKEWNHRCVPSTATSTTLTLTVSERDASSETQVTDATGGGVIKSDTATLTGEEVLGSEVTRAPPLTPLKPFNPGDLAIYTLEPHHESLYDPIFGGLPTTSDNKFRNYEHFLSSTLAVSCGKTGLSTKCLSNGYLRTAVAPSCTATSVIDDSLLGEIKSLLLITWVSSCINQINKPGIPFFAAWYPKPDKVVSVTWEGDTSYVVVQSTSAYSSSGQYAEQVYRKAIANLANNAYFECFVEESVSATPSGSPTGCRLQLQLSDDPINLSVHNLSLELGIPHSHVTHWLSVRSSNSLSFYVRSPFGAVSSSSLCDSTKSKLSKLSSVTKIMTAEVLKEELEWHKVVFYSKETIDNNKLSNILAVSNDEVSSVVVTDAKAACAPIKISFYYQTMRHSLSFVLQQLQVSSCDISTEPVGERLFFKGKSMMSNFKSPNKEIIVSHLQISSENLNYFDNGEFSAYVRLPAASQQSAEQFVSDVRDKLKKIPDIVTHAVGSAPLSNVEKTLIVACEIIGNESNTCPPSFDPISVRSSSKDSWLVPVIIITAGVVVLASVFAFLYLRNLPTAAPSNSSFDSLESHGNPLVDITK